MLKRFLIVTKGQTRAIELHPMKEWLRQHADETPAGMTADHHNSHQLRDGLRRRGWTVTETEEEVRIVRPEVAEDADAISVLGEGIEDAVSEEEQFEFALESHLRDFTARNLATLPITNKRLKLFVGPTNRNGVEYPTDVGPIDILAEDESGNLIVFELKLSRGPDRAMGQLLRYMGWVKKILAGQHEVYGIIVARDMDEKLQFAALPVPNVSLLEYEIDFRLRAARLEQD
jgi:endonuclease